MILILVIVKVLLVINHRFTYAVNSTDYADHICYREETYTEQIRIPVQQPVKVRSSNWCLEFPPRCSNYKTEIREVIKVQNVTKTRTIGFCCEGYARITRANDTVCKPICRGGCGRGYCRSPNDCNCDIGYSGKHCTERCDHDHWGENCLNVCKCKNGAVCDNKNGICHCNAGWIGEACDQPCPIGYYGLMCKKICDCISNHCNPETGECIFHDGVTYIRPVTAMNSINTDIKLEDRINATEWIRVNTSDKKKSDYTDLNATTTMIESLNSTIANLTENVDKLTKNLEKNPDPATYIVPETVLEVTTVKTVQEVFFIKPENQSPAIIVHHPPILNGDETNILQGAPEVIHVIANLQQHLKQNETATSPPPIMHHPHDLTAVISVLIVLAVVVVAISIGFVIMYRRYLERHRDQNQTPEPESPSRLKPFPKPLPDLPAFTQNLKRTEIPEFYESPPNNAAINSGLGAQPYSYTTASLYSVVSKNYPRKSSLEHLYDEIKYPSIGNSVM